jgi:hypothetical protein
MKKAVLTTALLSIGICATIGFTNRNVRRRPVNTRLDVKELRQYGLVLVKSTDASSPAIDAAAQNQVSARLGVLKPFSVFLKNTGDKSLIAFNLKWEVTDADGQVFTSRNGYMNSQRLFNAKDKSKTKSVLELGAAVFCSVAGVADTNQLANVQFTGARPAIGSGSDDSGAQGLSQNERSDATLDALVTRLSEASSITVSIDGALFEDGTFVGPDSNNFFGWLSSLVKARRDLLEEVTSIERGGDSDAVRKRLEDAANSPKVSLGPESSFDDFYSFNRKRFAQRLLKKRNDFGDEAVRRELGSVKGNWLNLRKL